MPVSTRFPKTHPKAGELTFFKQKILLALMRQKNPQLKINAQDANGVELEPKFHTCRANLKLWKDRISEVLEGRAVIELFEWEDKPYRSKQIVFATLDKDSGCGVQELIFSQEYEDKGLLAPKVNNRVLCILELSKNDGLDWVDFRAWFKNYDISEPMAIIHFTSFRY